MYELFKNCTSLIFVDMSYVDSSNTTSYEDMFNGCSSLKNINLGDI